MIQFRIWIPAFFSLLVFGVSTARADWRADAHHLTGGETSLTKAARQRLLAMKDLDRVLKKALLSDLTQPSFSDRFLAIDLISGLRREALLPDLIQFSKSDTTGFAYLAINSFITSLNAQKFVELYQQRLSEPQTSAAAKVILLENLGRMNVPFNRQRLSGYLSDDPSFKVRGAALSLLRRRLLDKPETEDLETLRRFLGPNKISRQLRIQGLFLVSELSPEAQRKVAGKGLICPPQVPSTLEVLCAPTLKQKDQSPEPKGATEFVIAFGYKDARPARFVGDRYERFYLMNEILNLGFVQQSEDEDVFIRNQPGSGKVILKLLHSSVGADDQANRKNPMQDWQSQRAEAEFLRAVREARVAFYVGHSRVGGGPDFYPPEIFKSGKIRFSKYEKERPGYRSLLKALEGRPQNQDGVLGLFSCASSRHFADGIKKAAPAVKLISTQVNTYYMDSLLSLVENLKSLLQPTIEQVPSTAGARTSKTSG